MNRELGVWTYENSALVLIDYQKEMFEVIRSETSAELADLNVRLLARTAKRFSIANRPEPALAKRHVVWCPGPGRDRICRVIDHAGHRLQGALPTPQRADSKTRRSSGYTPGLPCATIGP